MMDRVMCAVLGRILLVEAAFLLPPLALCLWDGDAQDARAFVWAAALCAAVGFALCAVGRRSAKRGEFLARSGFVTVALAWIAISLFGALPFWLSGAIPHFVDALFETVSGFTTTGSSILSDAEALGRGMLYWRSFTHWVGGMGILVFTLAIVNTKKNAGTMNLMRAESPGPSVGRFTPRIGQTARILYGIYLVLTVLCVCFLLAGGMPLFDSLCTAYGTAGTGGFGIKNDSMVSYSPYLQNVCTVFMFLFGINFNFYVLLLLRQFRRALLDEEVLWYFGIFLASGLAIAWNIRPMMESAGESLHHAFFQVSSIMTTTGFATADFNLWPPFSKAVLLCLMALGACAGSTGGGLKVIRAVLLAKGLRRNVHHTLHPNSVRIVHLNGAPVGMDVLHGVGSYLAAYCLVALASFLVVSLDGFSVETNLSAMLSCFNNIGPALDAAGPMSNFGAFSNLSKLVLTADMLLGRLEIFPILALFSRRTWRMRRPLRAAH